MLDLDIQTIDFNNIVEDSNKPMPLIEIMNKFNPSLPFRVKKVVGQYNGITFTITDIPTDNICPCDETEWTGDSQVFLSDINLFEERCQFCNKIGIEGKMEFWLLAM